MLDRALNTHLKQDARWIYQGEITHEIWLVDTGITFLTTTETFFKYQIKVKPVLILGFFWSSKGNQYLIMTK